MRPYTITQFDENVNDIAARFHVDPNLLAESNMFVFPTGSTTEPIPQAMQGQVIQIPCDEALSRAWMWETFTAKGGESLDAVCAKLNKDRRINPQKKSSGIVTPPWLTPKYLLELIENASMRAAFGGDPAAVKLTPGFKVHVPYPFPIPMIGGVGVAPGSTSTVDVEPDWVRDLRNTCNGFRDTSVKLEKASERLRKLQAEGLNEARRLIGMTDVLGLLMDHPEKPKQLLATELAELRKVKSALSSARDAAMDALFVHIMDDEGKGTLNTATAHTHSLFKGLLSDEFKALIDQLKNEVVRYPAVVNDTCAAVAYAYQVLADSPVKNGALDEIEKVVRAVASSKPVSGAPFRSVDPGLATAFFTLPPGEKGNALWGLVTLTQGLKQTAAAVVGNLPGPSSLAVALYRVHAVAARARILAAGERVTTTEIDVELAIEIAFIKVGLARTDAEGDAIIAAIVDLRVSVTETTAIERVSMSSMVAELNEIDARASNTAMSSARWVKGMSIVGLFISGFAVANMVKAGKVTVVDGSTAMSGLGSAALGFAKLAGLGETMAVRIGSRFLAGAAFVATAYQWGKDAHDGNDTTGDALGTIGSGLLLASLVPEPFSPVLAVAGGILTVASIAYTLTQDDGVRNLFRNGSKKWFLCQARSLQTGQHFKSHSSLASSAKALEQAILDADFYVMAGSQRSNVEGLVDPSEASMFFTT